ncbi:hypothetical protein KEM52_006235 [Ascosphaera acerosa]|nr:hypothetical protein KEM52_006235 [Ascosphaera acerosa]
MASEGMCKVLVESQSFQLKELAATLVERVTGPMHSHSPDTQALKHAINVAAWASMQCHCRRQSLRDLRTRLRAPSLHSPAPAAQTIDIIPSDGLLLGSCDPDLAPRTNSRDEWQLLLSDISISELCAEPDRRLQSTPLGHQYADPLTPTSGKVGNAPDPMLEPHRSYILRASSPLLHDPTSDCQSLLEGLAEVPSSPVLDHGMLLPAEPGAFSNGDGPHIPAHDAASSPLFLTSEGAAQDYELLLRSCDDNQATVGP